MIGGIFWEMSAAKKVDFLEEKGLKKIIIDPGIGFGKTENQNIEIIKRLEDFKSINKPILIALSRKSFITKLFNTSKKEELDYATVVYNTLALNNGNFILIITRLKNRNKTNKKVIVHTKRKTNSLELDFSIYHFNTFEDFFEFCCFLTLHLFFFLYHLYFFSYNYLPS